MLWWATARHPALGKSYASLAYQPMVELLNLLRSDGFRPWSVSCGGTRMPKARRRSRQVFRQTIPQRAIPLIRMKRQMVPMVIKASAVAVPRDVCSR